MAEETLDGFLLISKLQADGQMAGPSAWGYSTRLIQLVQREWLSGQSF